MATTKQKQELNEQTIEKLIAEHKDNFGNLQDTIQELNTIQELINQEMAINKDATQNFTTGHYTLG